MSESKRASPWPFVAISLLILLLSAFLYLKLNKRERMPEASAGRTPESSSNPPRTRRAELLDKARSLLEEGKVDEAAVALEEAKKLAPGEDTAELERSIARVRQDRQDREAQRQIALALGELKEKWDSAWKSKYSWDEAYSAIEAFVQKYPTAAKDPDYEALRRDIERNRDGHDQAYRSNLDAAKKLQGEGKLAQALQRLQIAAQYYPERANEIAKIRGEWEVALLDKEMIRITDVEVWIGSDEVEDEKPRRKYRGKPFKIDKYEVTNEEYAAFLAGNADHPKPAHWKERRPPPEAARLPVAGVRLPDAEAYATWAKKRVPTAEEWEKAARFIDGRLYPWGDGFPAPGSGEFFANSWEYWQHFADRGKAPSLLPVGTFPNGRSGFDVYDMAVNVWEWTSTRIVVERDGQKVEMAVLKGGSYMTTKDALRCSNRLLDEVDFGHPDYGFRCVRN